MEGKLGEELGSDETLLMVPKSWWVVDLVSERQPIL